MKPPATPPPASSASSSSSVWTVRYSGEMVNLAVDRRYEAELNLIIHSLGGQLTMEMNPEHIVLISRDVGPGIADIDKAMQEGFSTASEEARDLGFGAGMGLPNMRRNADGFSIESQPGVGTTIQMEFRLK